VRCKLTVNEFSCLPTYGSLTEFFCVLDVTIYCVLMVVTRCKGRGEVICVHTVKVHGGVEAQCPSLIIVLEGGRWSASCSSHFTPPAIEHSTHFVICLVGFRANLDILEWKKICRCQDSNPRLSVPKCSHYTDCTIRAV
jgi:hypothetical protein